VGGMWKKGMDKRGQAEDRGTKANKVFFFLNSCQSDIKLFFCLCFAVSAPLIAGGAAGVLGAFAPQAESPPPLLLGVPRALSCRPRSGSPNFA
jgi:hypothetical protein